MTAAVGIVCKAPRAGASKTRLSPLVGAEFATELSRCFITDIAATIEALPPDIASRGYAVFAPADAEAEIRALLPEGFGAICQHHAAFGEVLSRANSALLAAGHDCVLLVNSDSPTLPSSMLIDAIGRLRKDGDRCVLGPAIDGGYYLIGLKAPHRRIFEDIEWSTSRVREQSLERAVEIGLPVETLPLWYDVDDVESFGWLKSELAGLPPPFLDRPGNSPNATRALFDTMLSARADANVERRS